MKLSFKGLGGSVRSVFAASFGPFTFGCLLRPLGALLDLSGASWGPRESLLGLLEVDLMLNIIVERLKFSEGPSWSRLGLDFQIFWSHFELIFEGFYATIATTN